MKRGGFSDEGKNNQIEDFFTAPLGDISLQLLYSADLSKRYAHTALQAYMAGVVYDQMVDL
jgi:hypothetical protein